MRRSTASPAFAATAKATTSDRATGARPARTGGPARGRAVAHRGTWKLACGFARAAAGSPFCCCTARARPARCAGRVAAVVGPAAAGALAGAGPARSRRLAAPIELHLRVPGRRARRHRRHRSPPRYAGTFAGRGRRPGPGRQRVRRPGAGGHRPGDQGRPDRRGWAGRSTPATGLVHLARRGCSPATCASRVCPACSSPPAQLWMPRTCRAPSPALIDMRSTGSIRES